MKISVKYIIVTIVLVILIFSSIDAYLFIKSRASKHVEQTISPEETLQEEPLVSPQYEIVASDRINFTKFLPLFVSEGGGIIWHSVESQTVKFKACPANTEAKISFFLGEKIKTIFLPILNIDVLDGLKCDDETCYYKNIRLTTGQVACLNLKMPEYGYEPTGVHCQTLDGNLSRGSFYPIYSNIPIDYIIYCCPKGECAEHISQKISYYPANITE